MKADWPTNLLNSTRRTEICEIRARGGRIVRFTKFNRNLTVRGDIYRALPGFERTQVGGGSDFRATDAQIRSFFDAVGITAIELRTGVFDKATVTVEAVDWSDTTLYGGVFKGFIGEFEDSTSGVFDAQLLSVLMILELEQGKFTGPHCPEELGSYKCTVPINPFDIARSTPYVQGRGTKAYGKVLTGLARTVVPLGLTNAGFETGTLPPWTTLRGSAAVATGDGSLAPFEGTRLVTGSLTSPNGYEIRRVDDIAAAAVAGGLDTGDVAALLAAIDAGQATLEVQVQRANGTLDGSDSGAARVDALDADRKALAVLWDYEARSGILLGRRSYEIISPGDTWQIKTCAGRRIPANTRQLATSLEGVTRSGGKCNACWDDLQMRIILHGARVSQAGYQNRIFELVTPGTTAAVQPTYNTTPGASTTDGTTEWVCRQAWTRHAVVDAVISPTVLQLTIDEARSVTDDEWFEAGTLRAETGANVVSRGEVIKSWDGSTLRATLFLPFAFAFAPGDEIVIVKGCLKRPVDCNKFFYEVVTPQPGNIANFQGHPSTPGQDAISKAPPILMGI